MKEDFDKSPQMIIFLNDNIAASYSMWHNYLTIVISKMYLKLQQKVDHGVSWDSLKL